MEAAQNEFQKLDELDQKVAFWMANNEPHAVKDWTSDIHDEYARRKNIKIDREKLFKEILPGTKE